MAETTLLLLLVSSVSLITCYTTYTYIPYIPCLPYDGSVIPDCSKFVDPITKAPYWHEHSTNCSRFWECDYEEEPCLYECANCQRELDTNPLCDGQWALTFDKFYQYPLGPICDWPTSVQCSEDCQCH